MLAMMDSFVNGTKRKLSDIIPNFDREALSELAGTLPMAVNDESANLAFDHLANQLYDRVKKKFPKK